VPVRVIIITLSVFVWLCLCVYLGVLIFECLCLRVRPYVFVCVYVCVHICASVRVCACVRSCVCICVFLFTDCLPLINTKQSVRARMQPHRSSVFRQLEC
jgi:hypothetical protein